LRYRNQSAQLLIALMMETARTSETSVNFYQTTRRYNPEDNHVLKGLFPRLGIFNKMSTIFGLQPRISFVSAWTQHYMQFQIILEKLIRQFRIDG
jgi:hypothetical protein